MKIKTHPQFFTGARCECGREIATVGVATCEETVEFLRDKGWQVGKVIKCPACKARAAAERR